MVPGPILEKKEWVQFIGSFVILFLGTINVRMAAMRCASASSPTDERERPHAVAMTTRIDRRFAALKREGRAALVTFMMAGDPDYATSLALAQALPAAGADVIELGMPFTDPMADGPAIQAAGLRALKAGQTLKKTLDLVRAFRQADDATPIVLMGYYNPIYIYGVDKFLADAKGAGVDGLIVVDLPPEEDDELCLPALKAGLNFIRLATPTTDDKRLPAVLTNTSGFVYYVSITGITGAAARRSRQGHARGRPHQAPHLAAGRGRLRRAHRRARARDCVRRRRRRGRLGAGDRAQGEPRPRQQGDREDRAGGGQSRRRTGRRRAQRAPPGGGIGIKPGWPKRRSERKRRLTAP